VLFRGSEAQAIGSVQWNLIKNTPELTTPHAEIRTRLNIMHQHTDVMSYSSSIVIGLARNVDLLATNNMAV